MMTSSSSSGSGCVPSEHTPGEDEAGSTRPQARPLSAALQDIDQTGGAPGSTRPLTRARSAAGQALVEASRARLAEREQAGLLRTTLIRSATPLGAPWVVEDGRRLLGFASNDYLGLAGDPRLAAAARRAIDHYGTSASAAGLLGGRTALHAELEATLAHWLGQEAALVLPSGYQANLAAQVLVGRGERVLHDRLNHASLLDATLLARARARRYRHADAEHCAQRLREQGARLLVTESLFGMDGDAAPLAALGRLAAGHGLPLLVDEAHALGVLGPEGAGLAADLPVEWRPTIVVGTFGKALASQGACVAGPEAFIDFLRQAAPAAVYTTALAPAAAAATLEAITRVRNEPERRHLLRERVQQFVAAVAGFAPLAGRADGGVVSLLVGEASRATGLSRGLAEAGFRVPAIRPPTVPQGTSRLRVSLSALHTQAQVRSLADAIEALWPTLSGLEGHNNSPQRGGG